MIVQAMRVHVRQRDKSRDEKGNRESRGRDAVVAAAAAFVSKLVQGLHLHGGEEEEEEDEEGDEEEEEEEAVGSNRRRRNGSSNSSQALAYLPLVPFVSSSLSQTHRFCLPPAGEEGWVRVQ